MATTQVQVNDSQCDPASFLWLLSKRLVRSFCLQSETADSVDKCDLYIQIRWALDGEAQAQQDNTPFDSAAAGIWDGT
jgi:hypothetical protein